MTGIIYAFGMTEGAGRTGPKFRWIADDLRSRIAVGEFGERGRLPSRASLGKHYGAAINTVERAIEELRRDGRAETVHGSGTFIRTPPEPRPSPEMAAVLRRLEAVEGDVRRLAERVDGLEPATAVERQPVVLAVVTSGAGVLVTWRRDRRPPVGFVGGEIEPGESPAHAGVREVKEEAGLEVAPGPEIARRVHPATGRTVIYMASRPAGRGTEVFIGDKDELADVRWVGYEEAVELMPDMYEPVRKWLARTLRADL